MSDISNHTGGAFGGYVALSLSPEWRFQVGAAYTMKGWERDEPGTHDLAVVKLDYIEVPVLKSFDVGAIAGGGLRLAVGRCRFGEHPVASSRA